MLNAPRPGAPLIAVSAISAITAGAGLAFAVDSIFAGCGGSSYNRENIDFALKKLDDNDEHWTEVKSNLEEKFFFVASELNEVKQTK